jgi:hypothetical protein
MADIEAQFHNAPQNQPADIAATQPTSTTATTQTANPTLAHPRPPISQAQPPATSTNDRPHGNVPPPQIARNQGIVDFHISQLVISFAYY